MRLVVTGFGPVDAPHREIDRCLADLSNALRTRDGAEVRGRICLLGEKLAEHFSEEELLMRGSGWSLLGRHADAHGRLLSSVRGFERRIVRQGVTHEVAWWGLNHLPELLHHHCIVSDFGFAKFAMRLAVDPSTDPGVAHASPGCLAPTARRGAMARSGRRPGIS